MLAIDSITSGAGRESQEGKAGQLAETANMIAGQLFYGTLLKQLRSSELKGEYGHGGRGEEVFQAQLDELLAIRAGEAGGNGFAESVVKRYGRRVEALEAYERKQQATEVRQW